MPRWQRFYVVACAFVTAYALMYALVDYLKLPRLFHFQLEHELRFQRSAGGPIPAGYVGQWAWALVVGLAVAGLAWVLTRLPKGSLSERALGLGLAWSMSAVFLVGAYFTWNNWP